MPETPVAHERRAGAPFTARSCGNSDITLHYTGHESSSCAFSAYHSSFTLDGEPIVCAALATCPTGDLSISPAEDRQISASHELIEAATDAVPLTMPALFFPESFDSSWTLVGTEVADLCREFPWREGRHLASRVWSNEAAMRGDRDPCVPALADRPYFNMSSSPEVRRVSPGENLEIPLTGWSTAAVPDWDLEVHEVGAVINNASVDPRRANNGRTAMVHLEVPRDAVSGARGGVKVYSLRSAHEFHVWPVEFVVR